ncbi:MAG: DUF1330 domain-containing protein [Betaproteobacteria bacterium]
MSAYIVADIDITDPETYDQYKPLASAAIEKYGARSLVRGGDVETAEGDWKPKRFVILEFASIEQLRTFYDSPEYVKARAIRQKASKSNLIFVKGV